MREVETIDDFNKYFGMPAPILKDISVGKYDDIERQRPASPPIHPRIYRISLKYDFEKPDINNIAEEDIGEWQIFFSAPGTELEWKLDKPTSGYYIHISPELLENNQHLSFNFLHYGMHEALFLTKQEEKRLITLFDDTLKEYDAQNDSLDVLMAYINLIFSYIQRFYLRQFGSKNDNYHHLSQAFITELNQYYAENAEVKEYPNVGYFAEKLNVSTNYLSDIVKVNTKKTAKEHINKYILKQAKRLLDVRKHSISEIAYILGFEYPNYFARFFKRELGYSPSQYKKSIVSK
ncbi:AraC family transcriptional regulator (plasmid) [Fulvitalea axinellae]|uniref:AraC family transcriptional regulator n=1 Tax=Fulvitalea axinellae TaxID=1182444 RepID=A0AAU9CYW6_9BACT|nr:AraC family transcriptional regulator [Fulvitalea axinellae]